MSQTPPPEPEIDWESIILQLNAYARTTLKLKIWFRGNNTEAYLKGQKVEDYVIEGITRYFEHPEKFDPAKGTLLNYLKFNLIQSLINNDSNKKENKVTEDVFGASERGAGDDFDPAAYLDRILPFVEEQFLDETPFEEVKAFIEAEIGMDTAVENIFLGIYEYTLKRREIIAEFNMSETEYDNAWRRLQTIINKAAVHFNNKYPDYE